ncbi:MAG: hypothetical protein KBB26_09415, partial [Candidatus Omnitrophica bacterium]|nr:hypothetical protein [Candidatus Omnitrophota bacterium]
GLWRKNPDHIGYAKYYFYHMTRFILAKCGRTMPPATRTRGLARSFPRLRQNSNPVPDRGGEQAVSSEPALIFRKGN